MACPCTLSKLSVLFHHDVAIVWSWSSLKFIEKLSTIRFIAINICDVIKQNESELVTVMISEYPFNFCKRHSMSRHGMSLSKLSVLFHRDEIYYSLLLHHRKYAVAIIWSWSSLKFIEKVSTIRFIANKHLFSVYFQI